MSLREAILQAAEALDPQRQGVHWPDPIEWDGRPLEEQADDLLVALDARLQYLDTARAEYGRLLLAREALEEALGMGTEHGGGP